MPHDIIILNRKCLDISLGDCKFNIDGEDYDEYIKDLSQYSELNKIESWRDVFLDDYFAGFVLSETRWENANSCFISAKEWVLSVLENTEELEDMDIRELSTSFKNKHSYIISIVVRLVLLAKFSQNHKLKRILLATKNSDLCYISYNNEQNKAQLMPWYDLMRVRSCIKLFDDKVDLSTVSQVSRNMIIEIVNNAIKKRFQQRAEPLSFRSEPLSFLNLI